MKIENLKVGDKIRLFKLKTILRKDPKEMRKMAEVEKSFRIFILYAFCWGLTSERHRFWNNIYKQ